MVVADLGSGPDGGEVGGCARGQRVAGVDQSAADNGGECSVLPESESVDEAALWPSGHGAMSRMVVKHCHSKRRQSKTCMAR